MLSPTFSPSMILRTQRHPVSEFTRWFGAPRSSLFTAARGAGPARTGACWCVEVHMLAAEIVRERTIADRAPGCGCWLESHPLAGSLDRVRRGGWAPELDVHPLLRPARRQRQSSSRGSHALPPLPGHVIRTRALAACAAASDLAEAALALGPIASGRAEVRGLVLETMTSDSDPVLLLSSHPLTFNFLSSP